MAAPASGSRFTIVRSISGRMYYLSSDMLRWTTNRADRAMFAHRTVAELVASLPYVRRGFGAVAEVPS